MTLWAWLPLIGQNPMEQHFWGKKAFTDDDGGYSWDLLYKSAYYNNFHLLSGPNMCLTIFLQNPIADSQMMVDVHDRQGDGEFFSFFLVWIEWYDTKMRGFPAGGGKCVQTLMLLRDTVVTDLEFLIIKCRLFQRLREMQMQAFITPELMLS